MRKYFFLILAFWGIFYDTIAQNRSKRESKFHIGVDLQTKYVWRGMEMMSEDAAPVVFPCLNYSNKGLYVYAMGGYAINGKYAEVDLGISI